MTETAKRARNWKSCLGKLLLLCLSISLTFLAIEMALRIVGYGNFIIYQTTPSLYWYPKPDQTFRTKIGLHKSRTNSHGARGDEFELPKPNGVYRILLVGDSRIFGWGLPDSLVLSAQLEELLEAEEVFSDLDVEIINAGVNGYGYAQIHTLLEEKGLSWKPDLVILGDANNRDLLHPDQPKGFKDDMLRNVFLKNLLRRFALYNFFVEIQLREFYEKYRSSLIPSTEEQERSALDDSKQQEEQSHYAKILQLLDKHDVDALGLLMPVYGKDYAKNPLTADRITQHEAKPDQALIITEALLAGNLERYYQVADPVHPNADGIALVANQLVPAVVEAVQTQDEDQ